MHALVRTHLVLVRCLCTTLLQLQKERWVLNFHELIDVLKTSFHECNLRLATVVAISDGLAHNIFVGGNKICPQQLNKLEVVTLDEVELGRTISVHHEDSQK